MKPWMEEIESRLKAKVHNVRIFNITEIELGNIIKKRKNWSAPGIDGIQNFWWKKFKSVWRPLCMAMNRWINEPHTIPEWMALGRTVLLPKTEDLTKEKDYRPITCLNTSYKIFTGLVANYMKDHAMTNGIWDQSQIGTRENVLERSTNCWLIIA